MTWTAMSVILEAHQPSRALQLVVATMTRFIWILEVIDERQLL